MKTHTLGFIILNAILLTACGGDKDQNDHLPYDPSRPQTDNNID